MPAAPLRWRRRCSGRQHGPAAGRLAAAIASISWPGIGRWLALAFGALLVLLASRPHASDATAEYVGSLLLTVAGLMLVAGAGDLVLLFVGPGTDLDSRRTSCSISAGTTRPARGGRQVLLSERAVLGHSAVWFQFSLRARRLDRPDRRAAMRWPAQAAVADGVWPASRNSPWRWCLRACASGSPPCRSISTPRTSIRAPRYPNAALLSVVPKAAGFLVMARLLTAAAPATEPQSWQMVLVVSVLTMTFGNVMALWQDDLRRLLAYSSIANAGYMLLGLAVALAAGGPAGDLGRHCGRCGSTWRSMPLATIGAFAILEHLGVRGQGSGVRAQGSDSATHPSSLILHPSSLHPLPTGEGTIGGLAGLGRSRPSAAAVLSICLLSLTGLPPLAGFWGKLFIFGGALNVAPAAGDSSHLRTWFIAAAVMGLLNAAVAAAYYLRIVAAMYFRPLAAAPAPGAAPARGWPQSYARRRSSPSASIRGLGSRGPTSLRGKVPPSVLSPAAKKRSRHSSLPHRSGGAVTTGP